jgi:hypothetical protein
MVSRIVAQGPYCYRAVHKSAEVARNGCSFAMDAMDFCKRLFRGEDSLEALEFGLENIKDVANSAHQDAEEMHKQFKRIRVELFKVRFLAAVAQYMCEITPLSPYR